MKVYRKEKKFGGDQEEGSSFNELMAHSLDLRRYIRDVDWRVRDIHLGDWDPAALSKIPNIFKD